MLYAEPLSRLIGELSRLPTVGPRTAQRLAFHLLQAPMEEVEDLARAILDARKNMKFCSVCFNYTDCDPCALCQDTRRIQKILCVVADPRDVMAMERANEFRGIYHVLGGNISPMDGIGPDDLRIKELLERVNRGGVEEVIVATNPTVVGEATALYLSRLIKPLGVKVTRLAYGLPAGSDLEYADAVTLAKAMEGRRDL